MAFALGDLPTAHRRWSEAMVMALEGDDLLAQAQSTAGVGLVELASGDLDAAERLFREALPKIDVDDLYGDWLASLVHVWLGTVQMVRGDLDEAAASMRRGLAPARRRGDRLSAYIALYNLSQVATALGDFALARSTCTRECG
jgi:ATP/maltotriose-dependent transcriptional regulator MalT